MQRQRLQRRGGLRAPAAVQVGDDLQVGQQRAQLGGGAQLQLAAFVDVQRLLGGVGLHPDHVALVGAFQQREAVAHRAERGGLQQALADELL